MSGDNSTERSGRATASDGGPAVMLTTKNYLAWKEVMEEKCGILYGRLATVIRTGTAYVVPRIKKEDWTPPTTVPAETLLKLQAWAEEDRLKAIGRMRDAMPAFFMTLMSAMSVDSKQRVKVHAGYKAAELEQNPNLLWAIVVETHLTNVGGTGGKLKVFEREELKDAFAAMQMGDTETHGQFKVRYDQQRTILVSAGVTTEDGPTDAAIFLKKLHRPRYGAMITTLANQALRGVDMPQTLDEAYTLASTWKATNAEGCGSSANAGGGRLQSVFMLAGDVAKKQTKSPAKLPAKASATAPAKAAGKPATKPGSEQSAANTPGAASNIKRQGRRRLTDAEYAEHLKTLRCNNCGTLGHYARDCQAQDKETKAAFVAIGDFDDADSEYGEEAFMVHDESSDEEKMPVLLAVGGGGTSRGRRVMLDNQASTTIFKDISLVHDLVHIDEFVIGGVNGSAEGLRVNQAGSFRDLSGIAGEVGYNDRAAGNILSKSKLIDSGHKVTYDHVEDKYYLHGDEHVYVFGRRVLSGGEKSAHYTCDMDADHVLVGTVSANARRFTKREVAQAKQARELVAKLGHPSLESVRSIVNRGILNSAVTVQDLQRGELIFGPSVSEMKGKTVKRASIAAEAELMPRVVQVQQCLEIDIMFVRKQPYLLGVLVPLKYILCEPLQDRGVTSVAAAIESFLSKAKARDFDVQQIRCDGEGAVGALSADLGALGVELHLAGPGQHVPTVERTIRTVKERVRTLVHELPYVMDELIMRYCVLFSVSRLNLVPSTVNMTECSPTEMYSGRKLDAKRDLRVQFGDYVQATVADPDNSMNARTEGCIALLPVGNLTGSVRMLCLRSGKVVTRDQFTVLPLPTMLVDHLVARAAAQGYLRVEEHTAEDAAQENVTADDVILAEPCVLPDFMPIAASSAEEGRPPCEPVEADVGVYGGEYGNDFDCAPALNGHGDADVTDRAAVPVEHDDVPPDTFVRRVSPRDNKGRLPERLTLAYNKRCEPHDVFHITMKRAMQESGAVAVTSIKKELQQVLDKRVFHGVHVANLSEGERDAIIPSSMFLKQKHDADGTETDLKARLVAGGHMQDKLLYETLSSPTVSTASLMSVAAIAAFEERKVMTLDIGGAFINVSMPEDGVHVHMRLNKVLTGMLVELRPEFAEFVEADGTCVVHLDKALYGCLEASLLWYKDLRSTLEAFGYVVNPHESCVFNKLHEDGTTSTIALHVDDMFMTAFSDDAMEELEAYLLTVYPEVKTHEGEVLNYVGMTYDFSVKGDVRITMLNCTQDILAGAGVLEPRRTPATTNLFDVRDGPKASEDERKWFHTHVAKMLYLAKRVRAECLTAVSFLATRVHACDLDDLAKLRRLLGYLAATASRGICLRVGSDMRVRAYIDAAYGVHTESGKSHTGCAIVLGDAGPVFCKSAKQKIVTKSSTEAELVGLSDSASQAIQLRNFVIGQGYELPAAELLQDNMSTMALLKRGCPGSERSRHIDIRFFWVAERVASGEVQAKRTATGIMWANLLTKPVQGAQFIVERQGLTNWDAVTPTQGCVGRMGSPSEPGSPEEDHAGSPEEESL